MEVIASRLRYLRENKNVSQKEVAKVIGVTRTAYVKYEKGVSAPPTPKLPPLADYFNVSIDYLLGHKKPTPNNEKNQTLFVSNEEKILLKNFKSLTKEGQKILKELASFLVTNSVIERDEKVIV